MTAAGGERWRVRAARADDAPAFLELARLTGGGFTNLPPDLGALGERLAWSDESFAKADETPGDDLYMLALEDADTGRVAGTAALFGGIGHEWPFYSYKVGQLSKASKEFGRTITTRVLHLVNDYDGASEVGALFLHPDLRAGGLGRLLARSRYLFIAQHRQRFGDRVIAELRGVLSDDGGSPFWDGLAGRFFGMKFQDADTHNSRHGNQFIADLMPKLPVYADLLPAETQAVIGAVHPAGRGAKRLLEAEGFVFEGYIDIFDGGPTMCARTDHVRTVRESVVAPVAALAETDAPAVLLAAGRLRDFRVWCGSAGVGADGLTLSAGLAELGGVRVGDEVRHVPA